MNKVILMGRRQLTEEEKTRKTQQTSSSALHSARRESSLRDTCIKGQRL